MQYKRYLVFAFDGWSPDDGPKGGLDDVVDSTDLMHVAVQTALAHLGFRYVYVFDCQAGSIVWTKS